MVNWEDLYNAILSGNLNIAKSVATKAIEEQIEPQNHYQRIYVESDE